MSKGYLNSEIISGEVNVLGVSMSEPHTSELNSGIFLICMCVYIYIMVYGSTPYVGVTPQKMAATLKVHK